MAILLIPLWKAGAFQWKDIVFRSTQTLLLKPLKELACQLQSNSVRYAHSALKALLTTDPHDLSLKLSVDIQSPDTYAHRILHQFWVDLISLHLPHETTIYDHSKYQRFTMTHIDEDPPKTPDPYLAHITDIRVVHSVHWVGGSLEKRYKVTLKPSTARFSYETDELWNP